MIPFLGAGLAAARLPLICGAVIAATVFGGVVLDRVSAAGANAREIEHLAAVIEHNAATRAAHEAAAERLIAAERRAREELARERERSASARRWIADQPTEGAGTICPIDCIVRGPAS